MKGGIQFSIVVVSVWVGSVYGFCPKTQPHSQRQHGVRQHNGECNIKKRRSFHTTTEEQYQQQHVTFELKSTNSKSINGGTVQGPDRETKPDYENIHGPMGKFADNIFLQVFRTQFAKVVGFDSSLPKDDYQGLMELTSALNARYSDRTQVQKDAQEVLRSLFPSWLPRQYAILFSKPFPEFSARMNAWATKVGGTWLMGECEVNDIEINGKVYENQGLLVKRCRFLEESGCASVCVNACKIPTQNFFIEDMGLPLTMTPNYETYECQFAFGTLPTRQEELDAKNTPCLSRCPTGGTMRKFHDGTTTGTISIGTAKTSSSSSSSSSSTLVQDDESTNVACQFMDSSEEV